MPVTRHPVGWLAIARCAVRRGLAVTRLTIAGRRLAVSGRLAGLAVRRLAIAGRLAVSGRRLAVSGRRLAGLAVWRLVVRRLAVWRLAPSSVVAHDLIASLRPGAVPGAATAACRAVRCLQHAHSGT